MADLILKVDPAEVLTKAGEIEAKKSEMEGYLTEMKSKVSELNDAWQSESGAAYVTKYDSVAKEVKDALDALEQHVTNLRDVAQKYTEMETTQKQQVEALSTSDIF